MALVGKLVKVGIEITSKFQSVDDNPKFSQENQLRELLG